MTHPILKRPQALRDIEEIFVFLGTEDLDAAFRFLDAIERSLGHISLHPRSSPVRDLGTSEIRNIRMLPARGFKSYLIFYREINGFVEIIRVLHGARDIPRLLT